MASQCVCKRWRYLPNEFPDLLSDPCFTITRPDSIVDQDMLEDCASWLLEHGSHVTSLCLSSHQPATREEGKQMSWRESQLYVTATACLGACAGSLQHLELRWHQNLDLGHHFLLLRALTSLHVESDVAVHPSMLVGHTSLRELSMTAFVLEQGTNADEYLPPNLTRLHLDVDPDKIPGQLLRLTNLRALSLHRLDPHSFYRPPMTSSFAMLGHLTQLHELVVAHSHALELPPGLSRLTNLTYLSLRNTRWRQGDLEAVLAPLTALRAVDLSYQDLPSLPAPVVGLTGLRALAVAGGQFPLRQGLYCQTMEWLEVDLEWLGRESGDLARLPALRSLVVAGLGGAHGEVILRRRLAELLAAAQHLTRLILVAESDMGVLPLEHAARVVEFARERPSVEVQLCLRGHQPSAAEALQ
ncbi:hypothetical protein N2152v2_004129 [Parachlorella kessleri]